MSTATETVHEPQPHMRIPIDAKDLEYALFFLRDKQLPLLQRLDHDNVDKDTLARYATALMIEAAEFSNSLPWKAWKRYDEKPLDVEAVTEEFVDLLHFVGTFVCLLEHFGIHPDDIAKAFVKKNVVNHQRFDGDVEGYGVRKE